MKKQVLSLAVLATGIALVTACSSNDDETPDKKAVNVANGLFLVGSGNTRAGIDGNLSYIDYAKGSVTANAFKTANGKSLGKTANHVVSYGSKLYIVVDQENTIWVCDKATLKVQQQLSTLTLIGQTNGRSPRSAVAHDGMIYVSCYGASLDGAVGTVAAIDTVGFKVANQYTVGSYPDGLTINGSRLYVANSDYGNGVNPSVSVINLTDNSVSLLKHEAITNPMHMLTVNGAVYCLDYGTYDENWNQVGAGVRRIATDGTLTKVIDATAIGTDGERILTVYAPFGAATTTYGIYDTATNIASTWQLSGIDSPAMIAADPVTKHVFVVSYQMNADTGYPAYNMPSYINEYDAKGTFVKKYENTATGPISIDFNTGVKYE